jgi:hypothetical protein
MFKIAFFLAMCGGDGMYEDPDMGLRVATHTPQEMSRSTTQPLFLELNESIAARNVDTSCSMSKSLRSEADVTAERNLADVCSVPSGVDRRNSTSTVR